MKIGPLLFFKLVTANGEPTDGWVVAALHWRRSITWSWQLWWHPCCHGARRGVYRFHRLAGWNSRWFGDFSFQRQDVTWR
jgi:hypothetical protein